MKYKIILPAMIEELTDRCVGSIDDDIKTNLLIIDNSKVGFANKYGVDYEHHPENIGVARSWNTGARLVCEQKFDYLIILSQSIRFYDGMRGFIKLLGEELVPKELQKYGVETGSGWHFIAIGRPTFELVGFFDENFYPAYYEETDFIRRCELMGVLDMFTSGKYWPVASIDVDDAGVAETIKRSGVKVNFGSLRDYFLQKWGADARYDYKEQRDRMFKYPFNNPDLPINYFANSSVEELKRRYNIG